MPAHTTAELHTAGRSAEHVAQQQHLRIMIETMVRAGYSEPEITEAVERSTATESGADASVGLWNRLRSWFRL